MPHVASLMVRSIFSLSLLALGASGVGVQAQEAATTTSSAAHVRLKLQDFVAGPDGAKRLASLEKAVAKMKSLDGAPRSSADFRRSWVYWANIHGYLGPQSKFGTVDSQKQRLITNNLAQFIPYLVGTGAPNQPGLKDQIPPDDLAKLVWATCQHSPQGQQLDFFGWHRIYLYYFERVLRWAANDPSLTLPYWDYTDPSETALPEVFQDNGKPTQSPLYEWRRSEALNEGLSALNPQITDIDGPLTSAPDYLTYEGDIERGVHGNVHCSVGQTCPVSLMGLVAVAANDPIFYEHHANIDRMWSCWQHAHPDEKPGVWQNDEFTFVDENGNKVTRKVKDFIDTKALGYSYDNEANCTRQAAPQQIVSAAPAASVAATLVGSTQPISLGTSGASVTVSMPPAAAKAQGLAAAVPAPAHGTLVLRDVVAESDPGALLDVYVARKETPNDRHYVGTINWFGVFDHLNEPAHAGKHPRTFTYQISRQLKDMGLADSGDLTVTLEAGTGLVPSGKAAKQALAAPPPPAFRAEAKVTVGAVDMR